MEGYTSESCLPAFTLTWRIENFSFCTQTYQQPLDSLSCIAESLDNTEWFLRVYPRGRNLDCFVPCFLRRADADSGPTSVCIDYKISIIDVDGTACFGRNVTNHPFQKTRGLGFPDYVRRDVLMKNKSLYLPNDTLTIQCKIWIHDEPYNVPTSCTVCTRITIENRCFTKRITNFSSRGWDDKLPMPVPSPSKISPDLTVTFLLPPSDDFLEICLVRSEGDSLFVRAEVSLIDFRDQQRNSNTFDHLYKEPDDNWKLPACVARNELSDNRDLYLPDDVLCLHFNLHISNGTKSENFVQFVQENPVPNSIASCDSISPSDTNAMGHDIYGLFLKQKFCDLIIQTKTKYLLAHKAVVCARSPVFCDLLEKDGNVKDTGIIQIPDSDYDVVNAMLRFMYMDILVHDVTFDNALQLYSLAYKYKIGSLRKHCLYNLQFLVNLGNICDLLVLCDTNLDLMLLKMANDFISKNSVKLLRSEEWARFMVNHSQLASSIMMYVCLNK